MRRIELYPYSSITELLYYVFYRAPDTLRLQDQVPPNIDNHVLKEGALIDAYRYEAGKAAKKGDVNIAGFWRNESRAQETSWEKTIKPYGPSTGRIRRTTILLLPRRSLFAATAPSVRISLSM